MFFFLVVVVSLILPFAFSKEEEMTPAIDERDHKALTKEEGARQEVPGPENSEGLRRGEGS